MAPELSCLSDQWVELELKASDLESRPVRASVPLRPPPTEKQKAESQDVARPADQPPNRRDPEGSSGTRNLEAG